MTYRRLPSLSALRCFEAAARHGSLSRAAAELHVTPGAVSRRYGRWRRSCAWRCSCAAPAA
ncbi:LysR family transcriptional regulator [Teichococcus aestuarii]|uniref:LysR family transcriptional regulator n=1 Tax=Teichococcus aestuarii TaxID=568898 RepID=UPI00360F8AEF